MYTTRTNSKIQAALTTTFHTLKNASGKNPLTLLQHRCFHRKKHESPMTRYHVTAAAAFEMHNKPEYIRRCLCRNLIKRGCSVAADFVLWRLLQRRGEMAAHEETLFASADDSQNGKKVLQKDALDKAYNSRMFYRARNYRRYYSRNTIPASPQPLFLFARNGEEEGRKFSPEKDTLRPPTMPLSFFAKPLLCCCNFQPG